MKLKELIDYCNVLKESKNRFINCIDVDRIIEAIKQLDEPQPVKFPPFVAEIIEYYKGQNATLYDALREKNFNKQYNEWLMNEQDAYNKVARAWLDGYDVEKEKRYLVKMKGMSEENTYLTFRFGHTWMLSNFEECEEFRLHHTRKELEEAGFGWVFDCDGVGVEEVE